MTHLSPLIATTLIGIGATLILDLWSLVLRRFGVKPLDFALVGRWIGHLLHGRWSHDSIRDAAPIRGELALGWATHYAIGVAFAWALIAFAGTRWIAAPALAPALLVGVASVAAPFLIMQPAMGSGIASSKTPTPTKNRLKSLMNHTVFGVGLYLAAHLIVALGA